MSSEVGAARYNAQAERGHEGREGVIVHPCVSMDKACHLYNCDYNCEL